MAGAGVTFRDDILADIDDVRGIPGEMGLRLFSVAILVRSWPGARPGIGGAATDTITGLKVDLGLYAVKVRQLSQQDIIASAGIYQAQDIEVGPITPPFAGSAADNDAISVWDPVVSQGTSNEVFFRVIGPGYAAGGEWFKKVSRDVSKSFRYSFVLRKTAEVP